MQFCRRFCRLFLELGEFFPIGCQFLPSARKLC
jgi:hypothetical protein